MKCPNCGYEGSATARVCSQCGTWLVQKPAEQEAPQAAAPEVQAPSVPAGGAAQKSGASSKKIIKRGRKGWLLPVILGLLAGIVLFMLVIFNPFAKSPPEPAAEAPKTSAPNFVPAAPEPAAPQDAGLVYVYFSCEQERVSAQDEIAINYKWAALEQEQVSDYFQAAAHQIFINDQAATILKSDYGEMEWDDEEGFYKQSYWMNIGRLQPGEYRVETRITLKEKVFDGWDWFEPGQKKRVCNLIVE